MMFLVRSQSPLPTSLQIKVVRRTPAIVSNGAGKTDYFCVGTSKDIAVLGADGCEVVELRDGWYEDDNGGGVAIFGHGKYWELRETPFTVKECCGPGGESRPDTAASEQVDVRGAIFGV